MRDHQTKQARRRKLRAKIRQAALSHAPMWLTGGKVARGRSVQRLHVERLDLPIAHLPAALAGLRIAHLSDLHVGPVLRPADLPRIVAAVQALEPDLVAVTGDFVDLGLEVLDDVIAALRQLTAPLGTWLVLGNHDHLDDPARMIVRFRQAGLNLLLNDAVRLEHHGVPLMVAGIDYAARQRELAQLVQHTLHARPARQPAGFRLLLAHHPEAFPAAARHGVHLTLAGHTHGGQVMLAPTKGKRGSIGLGAMAFRYPRGLYRENGSYLYVTTGVGAWFPLRVRCPAEVALLTLRSA